MALAIAALLGLGAAVLVLYPLLGFTRSTGSPPARLPESADQARAATGALREIEFDYRLGNLADADYEALRGRYERRALAALRANGTQTRELDELIDRRMEALRADESTKIQAEHSGLARTSSAPGSPTGSAAPGRHTQRPRQPARSSGAGLAARRRGGRHG
jgi:hypothetical protein